MGIALPQVVTSDRASGAQVVDGSLKFNSGSSNYLSRTPSFASNRKTWTWSAWVKRSSNTQTALFHAGSSNQTVLWFDGNHLEWTYYAGGYGARLRSTALFRDFSAWMHVVFVLDTTQATANSRMRMYVNGVELTDFAARTNPSQNAVYNVNNTVAHQIGRNNVAGGYNFNGYLAEVNFIDGQALGPESFGFTDGLTNTWRPKKYTGDFNFTFTGEMVGPWNVGFRVGYDSSNTETSITSGNSIATASNGNMLYIDTNLIGPDYEITFTKTGGANNIDFYDSSNGSSYSVVAAVSGNFVISSETSNRTYSYNRYLRLGGSGGGNVTFSIVGTATGTIRGVNGFYLPMDGNSPIGKDLSNPNPINNGRVWSNLTTPSNTSTQFSYTRGFDGVITGDGGTSGFAGWLSGAGTITITFPSGVVVSSTVTIYSGDGLNGSTTASITVNGSTTTSNASSGYVTTKSFPGVSGNLESITLTQAGGGVRFYGIAIDGVVLVDDMYGNFWTPVNFGGSVALDNPQVSGAKPILNTDGGGNVARPGVFGSEQNVGYAVTVYDDGGGNKYYIDGTKQATLNGLIRGATYTFDTSDSTLGSTHPFRLSATSAHGTEYTDGVVAITGAATTITVPHNAPNSLYYYCTAHSGMGSSITGITTNASLADPYAWKNTLALPLVGSANDVSNSVNSGSTTKTITNNGVNISNANSNFYGGSHYWDGGTTDRLTVTYNSEFQFGTGDFCVEFWVNLSTTSGNQYFWDFDTNGGNFQYNGNVLSYSDGVVAGSGPLYSTGITLAVGKWHHLAVTRESSTAKIFVDGVMRATGTTAYNYNQTSVLDIGNGYNNSGYEITGYMQDFRIYKGVAKYTNSFVVPATSPDVLPDTPSGVSGSSKLAKVTDGAVTFDGTNDYLNAGDSSDYAFGTGDFTIEAFVYHTYSAQQQTYFADVFGNSAGVYFAKREASNNNVLLIYYSDVIVTGATPLTENRWYHVAVSRSGSTIRVFLNGVLDGSASDSTNLTSTEYYIGESPSSSSGEMFGFISNFRVVKGTALYTSSFTPPTRTLTNVTNTKLLCCQSQTSVHITAVIPGTFSNDGTTWSSTVSGAVAGSPYDATKMFDGNLATYTDHNAQNSTITWTRTLTSVTSLRVYIHQGNSTGTVTTVGGNGTQVDTISTDFGPGWHNITLGTTGSTINSIAFTRGGSGNPLSIHAVEVNGTALIDGFIGKPVLKSGDSAATTFNPFTTDINAVRGQETGYATMNPLDNGGLTLANGNLDVTMSTSAWRNCRATTGMTSGKWYFEVECKAATSGQGLMPGILNAAGSITTTVGANSGGYAYNAAAGQKYNNNSGSSYGASFDNGDTISVAYDGDNGTITFYKNGVSQGVAFTSIPSDTYFPAVAMTGTMSASINFGQKPFKFPPPDGFQPLNGANVRPETVITRPDQFVGTTLYSGNNGTTQVTTGFQPDFVWLKGRSETLTHRLVDSVRGDYQLKSNTTDAQSAWTMVDILSNGFTVTNDGNEQNKSGTTYVSWAWKAGGNKNTFNVDDVGYASAAAAGLTGGTLNPTGASVGTNQGFSIIKWTGNRAASTVSHGLNSAVKFYFVKNLDQSSDWITWHTGLSGGGQGYIRLNTDGSAGTASTPWNSTIPTNTVFSLGADSETNGDGDEMIVYLWADVPGLQKFGKYTGNNDSDAADGPFVELGFRPGLVAIKRSNGTGNWVVYDNKRDTFNPLDGRLKWNTSGANVDNSGYNIDFLSNGFKITGGNNDNYNAASDYIYAAWAEAPTFNLFGGQSNAR